MLKISSLKKLVTDSMAIDLGTANTIIAVKGRGIVLDEPSMVAVNEISEEIVAFVPNTATFFVFVAALRSPIPVSLTPKTGIGSVVCKISRA